MSPLPLPCGTASARPASARPAEALGLFAAHCLTLEVMTYPKPGLVSHIDQGAHQDMDAGLLVRSADRLAPFFIDLALAGAEGAGMERLRQIGLAAERAMLATTGGINTHRGAIFGLGLLCAAAGFRAAHGAEPGLGGLITSLWGTAILAGPQVADSHGAQASRRYGIGGARAEAASGMPAVYQTGRPALRRARSLRPDDEEAVRVELCMALIATVADTNLLHRGGADGLAFAQQQAAGFLANGGIGQRDWHTHAVAIHHGFVARNLSPGGAADLLAMTLFVDEVEG